MEDAKSINEMPHSKKIECYSVFYRIRIGDYRLGLEKISANELALIRFLHRKEIYRYFPRK
jgi:mRNA interferase RelE/StbE